MAIYCMDCGKEFLEKPESCPSCGSERIYDTEEISDLIHEEVANGGTREKLITLVKEREEGLASQEELDKVIEKEAKRLVDRIAGKFPELVPEDEE